MNDAEPLEVCNKALHLWDDIEFGDYKGSFDGEISRMMLYVRSLTLPPNYEEFKKVAFRGRFFFSKQCSVLSALDFSIISRDADLSSENTDSKDELSDQQDVFFSSVVQ